MKKSFLKFYDKLVIIAFMGILVFSNCAAQKKTPQKSSEKNEATAKKDTTSTKKDTAIVQKDKIIAKKNPRQIIAMYGVRMDKYKVKDVK